MGRIVAEVCIIHRSLASEIHLHHKLLSAEHRGAVYHMPHAWRGAVVSGRIGQGPLSRKLRWRRALRVVAGRRVISGWQLPFSQLMPTSWNSLRQSQLKGDNSCSAFPRLVCAGTPRPYSSAERTACNFEEIFMHYVLLGVRENFHARQHAIGT